MLEGLRKTLREVLKVEIVKGSGVDASVLGEDSEGENSPLEFFDSTTDESILQKSGEEGDSASKNSTGSDVRAREVKTEEDTPNSVNTKQQIDTSSEDDKHKSEEDDAMSSKTIKLQYCLDKDHWKICSKRLDFYFISKKIIDNEQKVATLLTRIDEEAFKLFEQLTTPDELSTKTYAELVKTMTDHLHPQPSQAMERCVFNQAKQVQDECIAEFTARLKKLSLNCGFTDFKDKLCDQLVCGLRDKETRVKLFEQEKLNYDTALKIAVARESAVKNATGSLSALEHNNTKSDVYTLRNENKGKPWQKKNDKRYGGRNGTQNLERQPAAADEQPQHSKKRSLMCYCSGRANHTKGECRYREYKCKYCNKQGHLERVCKIKQAKEQKSKTSVNILHEGSAEEEEEEIDLLKKMEFYKLELNENECKDEGNDIYYEKITIFIILSINRKMYVKMKMLNQCI